MGDDKLSLAFAKIDAANGEDPRTTTVDGLEKPEELVYSERMTSWLAEMAPEASDALRIAARAQHIRRWTIPRDSYPMDRAGYKDWRSTLAKMHASEAEQIAKDAGYDDRVAERVRDLILKKRLKVDDEAQMLEDVICLVFLESYFTDFAAKHDEAKLIRILQKTWAKMSERGRDRALQLDLQADERALIERALA